MAVSKNSRVGRVRSGFYEPDSDCLRKHNYSTGAGWRTKNKGKINFKVRRLHEGRRASYDSIT